MNGNIKVPCEVYSRITGYYRPTTSWNSGKCAEFNDRKTFDQKTIEAKNDSSKVIN